MGVSRPRWVGGFPTEAAAKAARDAARQRATRGEFVDRRKITVDAYLQEWPSAHALEVKPKTLAGYRYLVKAYVNPQIGKQRLQALRPATLSSMYRALLESGGRGGRPLSNRTVNYVHSILRKAFNDAMFADQILESNPAIRARRPRRVVKERTTVWTPSQLGRFLTFTEDHRLHAFFHLAAFTGARRGGC